MPNCRIDLWPLPVNDANQLDNFMLLWSAAFFQFYFFKKFFREHYQSAKQFDQDQNPGSVGPGP